MPITTSKPLKMSAMPKDPVELNHEVVIDPLIKHLKYAGHNHNGGEKTGATIIGTTHSAERITHALQTQGYYHIPSVFTPKECQEALNQLWDFVEDVSGGRVCKEDVRSWFPERELHELNKFNEVVGQKDTAKSSINGLHPCAELVGDADESSMDDLDPWPHTGYSSFPDMFQSLGAGLLLGQIKERLAERVFEPLFGTRELLCSKEGFSFCRPLIVEEDYEVPVIGECEDDLQGRIDEAGHGNGDKRYLWNPYHHCVPIEKKHNSNSTNASNPVHGSNQFIQSCRFRPLFKVCGKPQPMSEGQHYDQGVPCSALEYDKQQHKQHQPQPQHHHQLRQESEQQNQQQQDQQQQLNDQHQPLTTNQKHENHYRHQYQQMNKQNKQQPNREITGLCHIQASVSFSNQTLDKDSGGGHFLCYPYSHSGVHRGIVGGTYRATNNASNLVNNVNNGTSKRKKKQQQKKTSTQPQRSSKQRSDPTWVPLTDNEIERLTAPCTTQDADVKSVHDNGDDTGNTEECHGAIGANGGYGCNECRIYANLGDVILWRSDLVHAGVAPSLIKRTIQTATSNANDSNDVDDSTLVAADATSDATTNTSTRVIYEGPRRFRAVAYCSMLPVEAVKEYLFYSLPRYKLYGNKKKMNQDSKSRNGEKGKNCNHTTRTSETAEHCNQNGQYSSHVRELINLQLDQFYSLKLEAYRTSRTGDHRPNMEGGECTDSTNTTHSASMVGGGGSWHSHRRVTMWNAHELKPNCQQCSSNEYSLSIAQSFTNASNVSNSCNLPNNASNPLKVNQVTDVAEYIRKIPPRIHQRPYYRFGPPEVTVRQAELYGLLPYQTEGNAENSTELQNSHEKVVERAIIRGVRFVPGVYTHRYVDGTEVGTNSSKSADLTNTCGMLPKSNNSRKRIPLCLATMEILTPKSESGDSIPLLGQDKYLGGMSSPCGRFIYGVPGHAKRVIKVTLSSGRIDFIGPEYSGEFKWLRGVEVPREVMGILPNTPSGDWAYPSGCCLALPCNSEGGCVLKIDPETDHVSTFGGTREHVGNLQNRTKKGNQGWLYHGGNLALHNEKGYVYAIPASASRVLKIDPRLETTAYIGPCFEGKAKWYGGITGSDGCIYGIPQNARGVLRIDPCTQGEEIVTVLGLGTNNVIDITQINDNDGIDDEGDTIKGMLPKGNWKWHGGLSSHDGTKIIGFPNNANSILVIDVPQQRVYLVDGNEEAGDSIGVQSRILKSGSHRIPQDDCYKYLGGAVTPPSSIINNQIECSSNYTKANSNHEGEYAYLFPCDAEQVLRYDFQTDEIALVGPKFTEGENKYQNGFYCERDGCIYGITQRSCGVLRIVPKGGRRCCGEDGRGDIDRNRSGERQGNDTKYKKGKVEEEVVDILYCGDGMVSCKDKFEGGVLGADGNVYCIPLRAKGFVKIVPGPSFEG